MRYSATPLETIKRTKFTQDAARLIELIAENQAVGFVLGLPLDMDGSEGPRVQSTAPSPATSPPGSPSPSCSGTSASPLQP